MKTIRTFNGYWFLFALIAAVAVGELAVWRLAGLYGFRLSHIAADALCIGVVLVATSILYEGADIN
ncbi:MAG TPA: hypothetical protein VHO24_19015 [Opitutaceae bacterium]|nr:hypothetical protein [Opitutaceae bacterium]